MIPTISSETIEGFIARLNRPVITIEVANRFGLGQHEANLRLERLHKRGILSRGQQSTGDHGLSYVWSLPTSGPKS